MRERDRRRAVSKVSHPAVQLWLGSMDLDAADVLAQVAAGSLREGQVKGIRDRHRKKLKRREGQDVSPP